MGAEIESKVVCVCNNYTKLFMRVAVCKIAAREPGDEASILPHLYKCIVER